MLKSSQVKSSQVGRRRQIAGDGCAGPNCATLFRLPRFIATQGRMAAHLLDGGRGGSPNARARSDTPTGGGAATPQPHAPLPTRCATWRVYSPRLPPAAAIASGGVAEGTALEHRPRPSPLPCPPPSHPPPRAHTTSRARACVRVCVRVPFARGERGRARSSRHVKRGHQTCSERVAFGGVSPRRPPPDSLRGRSEHGRTESPTIEPDPERSRTDLARGVTGGRGISQDARDVGVACCCQGRKGDLGGLRALGGGGTSARRRTRRDATRRYATATRSDPDALTLDGEGEERAR